MGRYLLIEFDDNESADRMRALIDSAEAKGKPFRVLAMFSKPSTLCKCLVRSETSLHGQKYRWWICPTCRKPKSLSPQTLMNMLDDPETPSKYRDLMLSVRWIWDESLGRVRTATSLKKEHWK